MKTTVIKLIANTINFLEEFKNSLVRECPRETITVPVEEDEPPSMDLTGDELLTQLKIALIRTKVKKSTIVKDLFPGSRSTYYKWLRRKNGPKSSKGMHKGTEKDFQILLHRLRLEEQK